MTAAPLFPGPDARAARAVSELLAANPFLPERIEAERHVLGVGRARGGAAWSSRSDPAEAQRILEETGERALALAERGRERIAAGLRATTAELELYDDVAGYALYAASFRVLGELEGVFPDGADPRERIPGWTRLRPLYERLLAPLSALPGESSPAHVFAVCYQARRGFHQILHGILGGGASAARLRATMWQSIFTHDLRRYRRHLHARIGDVPTLVTGPTGTGKEVVARSIGLSRYIPFDAATQRFAERPSDSFHGLSIAALSPMLVESELFGHRRGAFTGAAADHAGWLEVCRPFGTVFLDEVGEIEPSIQVKLLRVIQTRTFQRLGESSPRPFRGKLVAATNRNLAAGIADGSFRPDFYYRLCGDVVETPGLAEQFAGDPDELPELVRALAVRIAGPEIAPKLAVDVLRVLGRRLPRGYAWPGNVRELEQAVRSVLVRGDFRPAGVPEGRSPGDALADRVRAGSLTEGELLREYTEHVRRSSGSLVETAARLGIDRRTARARLSPAATPAPRSGASPPRRP